MKGIIKNKKRAKIIIYVIIIMIVEWLFLKNYYTGNPSSPPTMNIYYKENKIKLEHGDFNWFDKSEGGNSHLYGDPIKTLEDYRLAEVEKEEFLTYSYTRKPKYVVANVLKADGDVWKQYKEYILDYYEKKEERIIEVPKEEGIYIFIVTGVWDETHNTCHIFKIKVK